MSQQCSSASVPPTVTLTFCETVENHTGMQIIGTEVENGFTVEELVNIQRELGGELHRLELGGEVPFEQAAVLVIRGGVDKLGADADKIFEELLSLKWDTKYYDIRRQNVFNKNARENLNFADVKQEAEFEKGKGTIVNFETVPAISNLRDKIQTIVNERHRTPFPVLAEGNLYKNTYSGKKKDERGIGWHGDTERSNVIGVRFGATMCIKFAWFQWSRQISDAHEIVLNHGDIYIMSKKAVGCDWKRTKGGHLSLRHCAGVGKYVENKERGEYSEKRPEKKSEKK